MLSIAEALATAIQHHQAGQFGAAEQIYRQILASDPHNAAALHQLGMLAMQARQFDAAVDLIGQAIRQHGSEAALHANLGECYRRLGKVREAIESYQTALKLNPSLARIHAMLGIVLRGAGRNDEAAESFRKALKSNPEDIETRTQLGLALVQLKKPSEAEACFRRALRSDPRYVDAQFGLGDLLQDQDKLDEAEACYRAVLQIDPRHADAHNNLGTIVGNRDPAAAMAHYRAAIQARPDGAAAYTNVAAIDVAEGRLDEAIACLRTAVAIDPSFVLARYNLATALERTGNRDEALASFREVLRLDARYALAHLGIASVLQSQGDLAGAMANCLEALRIDPANAEAHNNLGVSWTHQARQDEAIECFRRAIQLKPDYAHAHGNLAVSLQGLGRLDEAILHHRKAIELEPTAADLHSNYLYALNYHPDHAAASIFSEHRSWGRRHADPLTALAAPHTNDRTPLRRLRIGYVSPNFMAHAVNFFVEPILTAHDRAGFEVFCYSDAPDADETTDRLRGTADHWRDILRQPDETVAEIVRADRIDILVDLTGHISGGARMLLFARKPAPIQVTYIGYQNTTGMLAMDYRLTDEYCDPPGVTDALHTEKLVRLPTTFFCYLPYANPLPVNPLPALANGYVTFGSINNFMKITPQVLETWGRLLGGVPRSRLLVRADMTDSLRQHLFRVFGQHGVGPERLELVNRVPRLEYLELIRRIDVALDPFPFNGHTTTCDCLWQGVPVVTRSGDTYVSRFGGSGLATLGLTDWIARTPDEYIDIASRLAGDLDQLAQLRTTLRERMAASPLLDFPTFTRNLETEYRRMWTRWCAR